MVAVTFNAQAYLDANPDVGAAGYTTANAVQHYSDFGAAEGRFIGFSPANYVNAYPDLAAAGITVTTALAHYQNAGASEGRLPLANFSAADYKNANPDLAALTDAQATQHYVQHGIGEGRAVSFSATEYLNAYPDLATAGVTAATALEHFFNFGRFEGRQPLGDFDGASYLAANPDLAAAGFTALTAAQHFVQNGITEDRVVVFDEASYLASYPAVAAAVTGGAFSSGLDHYLQFGKAQGFTQFGESSSTIATVPGRTVAEDDSITAVGGSPVTGTIASLLANDTPGTATATINTDSATGGTVSSDGTNYTFTPAASGAATGSFTYTINNDGATATGTVNLAFTDPAAFDVSVTSPSVPEGDSDTQPLTFIVSLDRAPTEAVSVNYQTTFDGTATMGADAQIAAGAITFQPGQTVQTVSINVNGDTDFEPDETVTVQFSGSKLTSAVVGTGTIQNDDVDTALDPQTFVLTSGTDTLTGKGGDDQFNGILQAQGASGTTAQPGDAINGAGGTDTFTLSVAGNTGGSYALAALRTEGVERVLLSNFDTNSGALTIDTALMNGVQTYGLAASNATGDVKFDNITSLAGAEMRSGAGDVELAYNGVVVAGSADAQALTVSNVAGGTFKADGIENLTVTTGVTDNTLLAVSSNALKSLTVTGDKGLKITNALDFAATGDKDAPGAVVNASALTGVLDIKTTAGETISITGGSVGDVFRLASLDDDDVLDGGDGVDVVMLSVGAETIDGGDGGELVGVSNVEILNVRSTHDSAAVDMADVSGVSNLQGISEAVRTVTPAGDAGDNGSHKISFSLNGTNYETASVDLSGDATADKGRTAAALKVSIDALDGFTATVSNDVVTVTNTNGGQVEISVTNANDQTYTVSAYKNYEFKNLDGTTAVDIFTGNNVTVGLAGPSGDADSLSVNLVNTTADKGSGNTVNELTFSNIETLNLDSSGRSDGKVNTISTLTAGADLGTLNVTGDTDLNLGGTITAGDLKTVNAATFTGNLTIAGVDEDQTITTGAGDDTVAMGANLNDKDVLYLGGNTSKGVDTVTATVNGTTATTGAYNITGAERINLTNSGTAVIDATGIVGASEIAIKTNTTSTTITGLAAGTAVGIGHNDTNGDTDGVFNVSLADATGSSDVLTFNLNDTGGSNTNTVDLKTTDVETVNMVFTDKTDSSLANVTADVDALNAGKIVVSGADGDTGVVLNLQTLDTDTTEVDASAFKGKVIATAGDGVAATFSLGGGVAHNVTGSSKADTFTVGTTTNDDVTIEGGSGEDVLNMTLGNGAQDFHNITAIETINFTVENGAVITTNADGNVLDGINAAKKVTFSGGNSLSTVTLGGSTDKLTDGSVVLIDLSNFGGKLENAEFDDDDFDNSGTNKVQLIGSARKDKVTAGYDADNGASVEINMQDVEVFDVGLRDSPTRLVMDMSLVTGLDQINITDDSSEKIKLEDLAAGVIVDVTSTAATATEVEVVLASASGDSDIQTFIVGGASNNDNVAIKTTDIETLNISSDTSNQVDLELADVAMTAEGETVTVNFTGSNDIELVSTNADITTINASDMTGAGGALIQSGRSGSDAVTYTGSGGDDTFIMANEADVIDGAGGAGDTLDVNINAVIGAIKVDLSQSGDQVTVLNGSSNPAIQQGFENVELDGYTGGESADVTGSSKANKIVGTSVADQIDAGAGNDTVEGGDGNDVINGQDGADSLEGGGGNDTIKGGNGNDSIVGNSDVDDIAGGAGDDTITGGGGNDTLDGGEGIDSITGGSGSDSIIGGAGNDIITGGGGTDTLDGGEGRDSITGGSGDDSIIGGADNDTITGGGGTDTLKGGSGNDSIVGNTGVDDITGGAGDDTITGAGGNDTINGGDGNDSITGGDNIDDITVGGGSDTVVLDSVAVANAVDGADRITGFVVGSGKDVIRVLDSAIPLKNGSSDGSIVLATGSDLDAAHGANANFTVATISTDVSTNTFAKLLNGSSTIAQLETAISTALGTVTDTNFVNTDIVLVAIDDGTHTGIIRFVSNGSDNASSDEISLLGILKGVSDATALVVDNFSIG